MYSPADCERFKPTDKEEKASLRAELFPKWMARDSFVLGWVGRDQWRKQVWLLYKAIHYLRNGDYVVCGSCGRVSLLDWDPARQQSLAAVGAVLESPPNYKYDRCVHCSSADVSRAEPLRDIYLWCHMADEPEEGWPLRRLEEQWGVRRDGDVFYTPEHGLKSALAPEDVPTLYKLWDGLLFLSGGEGFGLPVWEAMCCGLPVVYTNYSAHAELVGRANAGLPVGGILQPDGSCIWRMIADIPQVVAAVRRLYMDRCFSNELGLNGRAYVEQFRPEVQAARWHDIFQSLLTR
jgi:glycosyltransferase involved in cell wall biosynthesis